MTKEHLSRTEITKAITAHDKMNWSVKEIISMRDAIWENRCPGIYMMEEDVKPYTDAAIAALDHLEPFKLVDSKRLAQMRKGIG